MPTSSYINAYAVHPALTPLEAHLLLSVAFVLLAVGFLLVEGRILGKLSELFLSRPGSSLSQNSNA